MRSESHGKFLVVSQHIGGFIEILLMAFIAPDREVGLQSRWKCIEICLSKRNSVLIEKILTAMKPIVLAQYHPAVTVIFPHIRLLWAISWIDRGDQRGKDQPTFDAEAEERRDQRLPNPV